MLSKSIVWASIYSFNDKQLFKIDHIPPKTSNIRRTLVANIIVDSSPVGCSNYIFIIYLTPGLNGLGIGNYKTRWETFKF